MDNPTAFKLLEELKLQIRFSQFAWQTLRASLQALDSEKTFFYTESFLAHAIAVSRLLWPSRKESEPRGEWLRKELKITDQSPLQLRELKTRWAQPDEWLENWMASLETRDYVEMNIMPQGTLGDFKSDRFQRSLDPESFRFVFRGETIDLRVVSDDLRRLDASVQGWLKSHNPW